MEHKNPDETTINTESNIDIKQMQERGLLGSVIGGLALGPVGAVIGDKIQDAISDDEEDDKKEEDKNEEEQQKPQKKKGGSCSGNSSSDSSSSCNNPIGEQTPEEAPKTPRFKLKIDENDIPENWWDKIPDFDPRVYDAISMEQAAACVEYIFDGLPEIHDLEHQIEARKFRKICPRLKTQVPRTKVIMPKSIKYDTKIDAFIKDDVAY